MKALLLLNTRKGDMKCAICYKVVLIRSQLKTHIEAGIDEQHVYVPLLPLSNQAYTLSYHYKQ